MAGLLVLITSAHNTKLRLIRRLLGSRRQRESQGLFVCEGDDLVEAARAAGIEPVEVLVAGEDVDPALVAELSTLAHPPRVIGVYRRPDLPRGARPLTLALWHVGDPGNVGTLLRTADAFGAGVALSAGCADPTGPKALRASAGAIFRVPLAPFDEAPRPWTALVAHGAMPPDQVQREGSFVLGAEREGLPDDVVARCDARVTIPLEPGAESLNVATAGAIALYEARRPH
ncbi:MAG: TrmH family RNA methyltransferase [Gaiellaceae bacterium]